MHVPWQCIAGCWSRQCTWWCEPPVIYVRYGVTAAIVLAVVGLIFWLWPRDGDGE